MAVPGKVCDATFRKSLSVRIWNRQGISAARSVKVMARMPAPARALSTPITRFRVAAPSA